MSSEKSNILNWVSPDDKSGEFKRKQSVFRNFIENKPGAQFPPEKNRYHLFVSYACPWAHRAMIVRKLKGLDEIIPVTSVHWEMLSKGWRFITKDEESDVSGSYAHANAIHPDLTHLMDLYRSVNPDYDGRATVPILYDTQTKTIVNNESSEIIRMFYTAFDSLLPPAQQSLDLYPEPLRAAIDSTNEWTYDDINNGVYKSGFATTQEAYEKAVGRLFTALDRVEAHLAAGPGPYYHGAHLTEADVRLYPTVVRFDVVYVQHFKCNLRDVRAGYPHLHAWLRRLYWRHPDSFGRETTDFLHIKRHYTRSHKQINPASITPVGPVPDILPLDQEVAAVKVPAVEVGGE